MNCIGSIILELCKKNEARVHLRSNQLQSKTFAMKSFAIHAISNICYQHSFAIMTHLQSGSVAISNIWNQPLVVIKYICNLCKPKFDFKKSAKNKYKICKLYYFCSIFPNGVGDVCEVVKKYFAVKSWGQSFSLLLQT